MSVYERIGGDIKRVEAALERLNCRLKIFGTPDFEDRDIEALVARCRLNSITLAGLTAFPISANRRRPGKVSRRISRRLVAISVP